MSDLEPIPTSLPIDAERDALDRSSGFVSGAIRGVATVAVVAALAACSSSGSGEQTLPSATGLPIATSPAAEAPNPAAYNTYATSLDEQVQQLTQYEQILGERAVGQVMIFTGTPESQAEASDAASIVAAKLKSLAEVDITPYTIMEPTDYTSATSKTVNFIKFEHGDYDSVLKAYFGDLQKDGVTAAMLGQVVPFDETNTPAWGQTTDPEVIDADIDRIAKIQRSVFPGSKVSVLFDSTTYPDGKNWANGNMGASLVPYVKGLSNSQIYSFGLQGFPDYPKGASQNDIESVTPSAYLDAKQAIAAARSLGTDNIWLNTGTVKREYAGGGSDEVHLSTAQRTAQLTGVLGQAEAIHKAGFTETVNMFGLDKSAADDGQNIDWSYLKTAADKAALHKFTNSLSGAGIELSLFDDPNG